MICCQSPELHFPMQDHVALMMLDGITKTVQSVSYMSVHVTSCLLILVPFVKSQCEHEQNQKYNGKECINFFPWFGPHELTYRRESQLKHRDMVRKKIIDTVNKKANIN